MARVEIAVEKAYRLINHGACPLVTTGDGTRRNVAPINWTVPISDDPPLVMCAVGEGCYTDELLKASGEFALNVVGESLAPALLHCGKRSGRKGDKFSSSGLTPVPCHAIRPPRLAEAFGHVECRVTSTHAYEGVTLYVGRVVHAEVEEEYMDEGHLRPEKARTIHHLGSGRFAVADRLLVVPREK